MAIQAASFTDNSQNMESMIQNMYQGQPSAGSGLASAGGVQPDMFNQEGLYRDRARAYFMEKFEAPQSSRGVANSPSGTVVNFVNPRTNTSVLDGDKYINDQRIDGRMYNPYTKKYGSKATRNFNPGNITGMSGNLLYGASRIARSKHGDAGDRGQLVFNNAREGWKAMRSLMGSDRYNNAPIRQAFAKYQSDQKAWGNMLSNMTERGIDVGSTFNKLSPEQQLSFMRIRASHEGYKGEDVNMGMFNS